MNSQRNSLNWLVAVIFLTVFSGSVGATVNIPSDTSIGTWDPVERIYTLTTDVHISDSQSVIRITENGLTLDGNGHIISGLGQGCGVEVRYQTDVTIKNLTLQGLTNGVVLMYSSNSRLMNNTANSNTQNGIYLGKSSGNTLIGNTANSNNYAGIQVYDNGNGNTLTGNTTNSNVMHGISITQNSSNNTLEDNTANSNTLSGIHLGWFCSFNTLSGNTTLNNGTCGITLREGCHSNTLLGNTASSNNLHGILLEHNSQQNILTDNTANTNGRAGIWFYSSGYNTITGNSCNSNALEGIFLNHSSGNTLTGNIFNLNPSGIKLLDSFNNLINNNDITYSSAYGMTLDGSSNNSVYNNKFIDNGTQAWVKAGTSGNVFNLDEPIGGNYWSDWTTPDIDNDGFVDYPYHFLINGWDYLPWARQNGWANQAPVVTITSPSSGFLSPVNTPVRFAGSIDDPDVGDTHAAVWTITSESGSELHNGTISGTSVNDSFQFSQAGIYSISLTVADAAGESDTATTVNGLPAFIVVYDPSAGFVTGGGWIYSPAYALLGSPAAGRATFGFVAKYKQGATTPQGNTEFHFQAGDFRFKSTSYDWLVIAGSKAMFKGEGYIDGMGGGFKFMLTAVDGPQDKFRIKIWDPVTDDVIYDNKRGEGDEAEPTVIGGGSIVIHKN